MRSLALCVVLLMPLPAFGQIAAGNLPPDFYPQSHCEKPAAPGASPGVGDQSAMIAYNLKVRNFNSRANAFNVCVKAYVDRAQHDIDAIQAMVHAIVAEANAR